jgi:hypothetical protein
LSGGPSYPQRVSVTKRSEQDVLIGGDGVGPEDGLVARILLADRAAQADAELADERADLGDGLAAQIDEALEELEGGGGLLALGLASGDEARHLLADLGGEVQLVLVLVEVGAHALDDDQQRVIVPVEDAAIGEVDRADAVQALLGVAQQLGELLVGDGALALLGLPGRVVHVAGADGLVVAALHLLEPREVGVGQIELLGVGLAEGDAGLQARLKLDKVGVGHGSKTPVWGALG